MKTVNLPLAGTALALLTLGASTQALADEAFEREVRNRLEKLEQIRTVDAPSGNNLLGDKLTLEGLVEIEGVVGEGFDDESYSDLVVATVELVMNAQLNDKVAAELAFLYEEDETDLDVDVATLAFADLIGPVDMLIGKQYLPFGRFETALVNDTLVLELAETRKTAALFGLQQDGLTLGAYVFDGSVDREQNVENYGFTLNFEQDNLQAGVDYISSLAESDALADELGADLESDDGAFAVSGQLDLEGVKIIAEYLTAVDDIEWAGPGPVTLERQPSALQVELDFAATIQQRQYTFGFAIQETDEAGGLSPEQRISIGGGTEIYPNVALTVEFWHDEDYDQADGGTDESTDNVVVQLAAAF